MSDAVLGTQIPTIAVSLVRNSRQSFALRWTPPTGGTLDLSGIDVVLEIYGRPPVGFVAETVAEEEGTWLSTWTIDNEHSNWSFKLVNGAIVSVTSADRVVLLHARVEVQE